MLLSRVRCRQITEADLDGIASLLRRGFSPRYLPPRALHRLTDHPSPPGLPKYGYMLETEGVPVGALVLIFARLGDAAGTIRCNVSSWYVEPAFRNYATLLVKQALRHENVTFFNISPVPHTLPILEAQGYTRYCNGGFTAAAMLARPVRGARVAAFAADTSPGDDLSAGEVELLRAHQARECISLICRDADGRRHPFVFIRRRARHRPAVACLIYCRDIDTFMRFAGPLGRYLARRGMPLVDFDADGKVPGLIGRHHDSPPKYFKGPDRPRLGDTAYSERVIFGL